MHSGGETLLTVTEALQLVGLAPSLFVLFFLVTFLPRDRGALVPALYFLALACGFTLPLLGLYAPLAGSLWLRGGLLLGESTLAAFCFLLVMQFITGRLPSAACWLVLTIPLIGGSSMIYAGIIAPGEVCLAERNCLDIDAVKTLYNVFASAFVFLLLMYYASRVEGLGKADPHRAHKYWLVIALILLHLFVLAVDLARLSGRLAPGDALFTEAMFRLTFVYLVITSLFRVFYPAMVAQALPSVAPYVRAYDSVLDKPHVEKILALLEQERVWSEARLNRAALAGKAGIGEYHLSRVINGHFGKNFNELVNGYRIAEARRRLRDEPHQQITVIAFEAGFNSIASFNRVFKEKTGLSPTEFRNNPSIPSESARPVA